MGVYMTSFNQETKSKIAPKIKDICKKYGIKASLSIKNKSTIVVNIKEGKIDFFESYNTLMTSHKSGLFGHVPEYKHIAVDTYNYECKFRGSALDFLDEIITFINEVVYNDSYSIKVNIGKSDNPYIIV